MNFCKRVLDLSYCIQTELSISEFFNMIDWVKMDFGGTKALNTSLHISYYDVIVFLIKLI